MTLISIVVLNYRRADDTIRCVQSILEQANSDAQIIVIDNHSQDGSAEKIKGFNGSLPAPFTFLELDTNNGFSAGNNAGIRFALDSGAQYIWLLNNDTVLLPGAFRAMDAKKSPTSVLGSVLYDYGTENIQTWGGGLLTTWSGINRDVRSMRPLDYVTGASMLFPRSLVEAIGLWDETFFLYWEDIDFSHRARTAGFELKTAEDARIWHRGGASTVPRSYVDVYNRTRNCFRFYAKHYPNRLTLVCLLHLSKFPRGIFLLRNRAYVSAVAHAYMDLIRALVRR